MAGVATAAFTTAACTSADNAPTTLPETVSDSPTAESTPTASASPTPTVPVMPPEAMEESGDGVEAFVRYAVEVMNSALATGDTAPLDRVFASDCSFCDGFRADIDSRWADGGRIETQGMELDLVQGLRLTDGVQPSASVVADITTERVYDSENRVVQEVPAQVDVELIFDVEREGDRWTLSDIRNASA